MWRKLSDVAELGMDFENLYQFISRATTPQFLTETSYTTSSPLNPSRIKLLAMAGVQYYTVFGQKVGAHIVC
jgi:hypothetical protein